MAEDNVTDEINNNEPVKINDENENIIEQKLDEEKPVESVKSEEPVEVVELKEVVEPIAPVETAVAVEPVEEVKAPESVEEVKTPEPVEEVKAPESVEEVKTPEPVAPVETAEVVEPAPVEMPEPIATPEEASEVKQPESTLNNEPVLSEGPKYDETIAHEQAKLNEVVSSESPLPNIKKRNDFYVNGYRILQKLVFMEVLAILGIVLLFSVLLSVSKPRNTFFATTPDGRLISMNPLSDPLMKKESVLSFASEVAADVMTFSFSDYRNKLQTASQNFTTSGWDSFLVALESSEYIETITKNRQIISSVPFGTSVVVQEGISDGVYKWSVEVPLSIAIEAGSKMWTKNILVKMIVARRSKIENDKGLGIDQWISSPYSTQ